MGWGAIGGEFFCIDRLDISRPTYTKLNRNGNTANINVIAPRINEKRFLKGCEWFSTGKGKRMVLLNVRVFVRTPQKPGGQNPGTEHLFARIFDRDFADILLFILLEQMFARGKRNERKRDNNDYLSGGRVIIASSQDYGY